MLRAATLIALLATTATASAQECTIAVVDFERAVLETREGKEAQQRLDTMYASRKAEIEKLQEELERDLEDYQARALVLNDEARAATEQELMAKQQRFEQTFYRYQQEMQQTYFTLLQGLDQKMRALTEVIAAEKGCDVVLDGTVVVYQGGTAIDLTAELITRYDTP